MMKVIVLLLCLLIIKSNSFAQELQPDSFKIAKMAIADADKYLRINKIIRKAYRQKRLYTTSDYFKPTPLTTSNTKLLADSNYIKVYRHTAFESTVYQIPLNRTKVVIVAVVVASAAVTVVIIAKIGEKIGDAFAEILSGIK